MEESLTKGGFTLTPKTGKGNAKVSISCSERTGRVDTSPVTFTAKMNGFSVSKSVSVVQKGKPEFVTITSATAVSVPNKGEVISITGITNSSKLVIDTTDFGMAEVYSTYTANGDTAMNNMAIEGDPGASNEFTFTAQVNVKENPGASSRTATITITTAGGQKATVLLTQLASEFTYDLTLAASPTSIQAGGGSSTITGKYKTFRNGVLISTEDVTPTCSIPSGTAFTLDGNKVSAPSRGTTAGELRSVQVSASYGNASSTITVSQEANQVESSSTTGGETIYNPVTAGAISNKTIPASGGSATATAGDGSQSWTTNKKYRHDTYTSGSVADVLIEDSKIGTDTIKPSTASVSGSAESKGTTVSGITTVKEQAVTWTGKGGKKATGTMYIYQAANATTDITYGVPVISSFTVDDIPASGGSISSGSVSYSQSRTQNYTSGATAQLSSLNSGGTITYSTAVSASSLGTTVKPRYKIGTLTATVTMNGQSASKDVNVYQAANHANYGDVSVSVTPNPVSIPAAGAIYNIKPTASQTASYTSGETKNCSISFSYAAKNTVTGFSNNNATVTVQQNLSTSPRNGFIVTVTASGEGSRTASVDVTFNQAAAAAYLNVDPATINIAADATSASFNIESNDSWTIS
jgi:hypothetical protein